MKVRKTDIPAQSLTRQFLPVGYTDAFAGYIKCGDGRTPDDFMVAFWCDWPWWVNWLFALRNFMVKFAGLKGSRGDMESFERKLRSGASNDFISFPAKSTSETVMMMHDSHLDAYISVRRESGEEGGDTLTAITLVRFHNSLGRVYFFFIRPFHAIIIRNQLKRVLKSTPDR